MFASSGRVTGVWWVKGCASSVSVAYSGRE